MKIWSKRERYSIHTQIHTQKYSNETCDTNRKVVALTKCNFNAAIKTKNSFQTRSTLITNSFFFSVVLYSKLVFVEILVQSTQVERRVIKEVEQLSSSSIIFCFFFLFWDDWQYSSWSLNLNWNWFVIYCLYLLKTERMKTK